MNVGDIKQILETIKTWNVNIDSKTAQEAITNVAGKVVNYLIFKEVLGFLFGFIVIGGIVLTIYFICRAAWSTHEAVDVKEQLERLDLTEPDERRTFERLIKEFGLKKKDIKS